MARISCGLWIAGVIHAYLADVVHSCDCEKGSHRSFFTHILRTWGVPFTQDGTHISRTRHAYLADTGPVFPQVTRRKRGPHVVLFLKEIPVVGSATAVDRDLA